MPLLPARRAYLLQYQQFVKDSSTLKPASSWRAAAGGLEAPAVKECGRHAFSAAIWNRIVGIRLSEPHSTTQCPLHRVPFSDNKIYLQICVFHSFPARHNIAFRKKYRAEDT